MREGERSNRWKERDGQRPGHTRPRASEATVKSLGFSLAVVRTLRRVLNKRRLRSDF